MRNFSHRGLSAEEVALAESMFGAGLRAAELRILQLRPLPGIGAFVPFGRTIVFCNWRAAADFSIAPLGERSWFIHELAHCAQARAGLILAWEKLFAIGRNAYRVTLRPGRPLRHYNIEAQAEIARLLFLARYGQPEAGAPPAEALEALWRASFGSGPRAPAKNGRRAV